MNTRKAVFLDIDGTLITHGKGPFREDLDQIEEAARQGHLFFLNTGRALSNIPRFFLDYPCLSGICAGTGTHVLLEGRTIYHNWVKEEILADICSWYFNSSRCCILEGENNCYAINKASRSYTVNPPIPISGIDDIRRICPNELITKLTLDGAVSEDEKKLLGDYFQVHAFSDYSEAILKGENKAKAMEAVIGRLGIRQEDTIAVGDSVNDLDMIRYAGLGIAMGNACDELKQAADAVTKDCGSGGAGEAIKRFALILPV
ncbi:YkrA [Leadbettera azotonutricia ZAS-9]|uniref:YkrA n=2 Tax=Leadbettera azotonutricia TaxID=150829 RepID=F5YD26_LEAAZ|nr:YkrA [Leadbettera azotonutricia ZAS-9]